MLSKRSLLSGAAVAALCVVATVSPATAQPAAQPAPSMIEALQRDLGLTAEQAVTRLANEARAASTEALLSTTLGDGYAGAWLNADATQLLVATSDATAVSAIRAKGAQPVVVGRSLAQLDALKARLDQAPAQARAGASLWYVDLPTNSVVVVAGQREAGEALLSAAGVGGDAVRVQVSAEQPQTYANIRGGDPYYIGSGSRCSIGFTVTKGSTPGFVTAGHCGRKGQTTSSPSGTFQGSSFPGNDYAWVSTPGSTPQPWVRSGGTNVIVKGSTQATVGASVCRSGSTTGWHCGTIQQHNTSVTYSQGTVYQVTRTNVCAEPGDSGGSFISGSQAQGVTSGGSGNCSSGGTTYFQPVNEILQTYGLTLKVG
ncbi:S1 family peptidase [Streptosporangium sp. NPDC020072]|uniref:S1 family peptidase n=1 Tax=Streptosporangium sp. NPDC020072 TaxID=3154788 RepID=UPI003430CA18